MTAATLSTTLREAIEYARNFLLDEPSETLLPAVVLEIIGDICIEARVTFDNLPAALVGIRTVAQAWAKNDPLREFTTLTLVQALSKVLANR